MAHRPGGTAGAASAAAGSQGQYTYSVFRTGRIVPVNFVSWGDAARFCNWLSNGQPTGTGDLLQDWWITEDGSYLLNNPMDWDQWIQVRRKPDARYVIPTEDEWYKAAYYDPAMPGGPGYWDYPTRSNTTPSNVVDPAGTNNANYLDAVGTGDGGLSDPVYGLTEVGAFD